jgi:hypothetical protein
MCLTDEEVYRRAPGFLIATVDKFANLPWVGESGAILGKITHATPEGYLTASEKKVHGEKVSVPPPDLVIQDELHLISGPLGTMVGLYEAAFDALMERDGVRPKVIASTATVRRAEAQTRALLGERLWLGADLLLGVTVASHRSTRWRGDANATTAPWSEDAPADSVALARWMAARERDCGVSQGAWRVLTGARLLAPLDGVNAGPPLQLALALGVARSAASYGDGARTGFDLGLYALFDPQRLRPGVLGRVAASWGRVVFALDGAWVMGAQGYAYVTLEVGVRLPR